MSRCGGGVRASARVVSGLAMFPQEASRGKGAHRRAGPVEVRAEIKGSRPLSKNGKLTVRCTAWRALDPPKGTLVGFVSVRVAEMRITFGELAVHASHGKAWAQLPGRPWVRDGELVKDDDTGKVKYQQIISFDMVDVLRRFSDRVILALKDFDPTALPDDVIPSGGLSL
jgi:hypothetical protein